MVDLYITGSGERKAPTEFRIFRAGINKSDKGEFLFDEEAAASVMAAFAQKGVDVSIDYDHQALRAGEVKAPAAGWCSLEVRDGELWACNVRWTAQAAAHLEAAEYRYFSPLFSFDDKTGRVRHVINSALTNTPALHQIDALVAASANANTQQEEKEMEEELKKRIAELERQAASKDQEIATLKGQTATAALSSTVGLAPTAGADEVRAKVAALVSFRKDVLGIAGKDSDAAAVGALTAMREQAAEVVELRAKKDAAELAALTAEFNAELDKFATQGEAGKFLPPAKRTAIEEKARKGTAGFTRPGIEEARAYLSLSLEPGEPPKERAKEPDAATALSAIEMEIAKHTGTTLEEKRKYKARAAERGAR